MTAESRQLEAREASGDGGPEELADHGHGQQHERQEPELRPVEQPDVGPQARVGEEQRQQQRDDEVLDPARHVLGQVGVARHDQAHHEGAEDQRDPDLLGRVGRAAARRRRSAPPIRPARGRPRRRPSTRGRAAAGSRSPSRGRRRRPGRSSRAPRPLEPATATAVASAIRNQAVTSSTAAQASASTPSGRFSMRRSTRMRASTGNAVIDIDTPMKSAKATNFVSGPDQLVDRERHREAEHHRQRDAHVRDRGDLADPALDLAQVELQADQEHVEDQAELGDHADEGDDVAREEDGLEAWPQRADDGRAEHDARRAPRPSRAAGRVSRTPSRTAARASITTATAMKKAAKRLPASRCFSAVTSASPTVSVIVRSDALPSSASSVPSAQWASPVSRPSS